MYDILFINPKTDVNPDIVNLQLVYTATIEKKKGKKVIIVDLNTKRDDEKRYMRYSAKAVFISIRPFSIKQAELIAKEYKKKYPKTKIYADTGIIDVLCCYPFIDAKTIKDKNISSSEYKLDFGDNLPFPDYGILDSIDIFKENWKTGKWNYTIMTSLGCPYQCTYCQSRNRKWKARTSKNCYLELKEAKIKYEFKQFALLDDVFNIDKARVIEFCKLIEDLDVKWLSTNGLRADRFDEDIAKAMSKSGCVHVGFGAESYDQEILNSIQKGLTIKQLDNAVDAAKKYFSGVHVFFIIGLPGSTYENDIKSLKWAIKKRISAHFSYFVPFKENNAGNGFYGEGARPTSDAYSKKFQEKIYNLTACMRGDYNGSFINAAYERIKLIWLFDRWNLPNQVMVFIWKKLTKR